MKRLTNWFNKLSTDKKVSAVLLAGIGIYLLSLMMSGVINNSRLSKNGVYYVARITKISSGKSGPHYYIEYNYDNKRYADGFKPNFDFKPNREGAYIFIKLLPNNPNVFAYLEEGEVSDSLLKTLPISGWKELPEGPRHYLLNGRYMQLN
ncbi:MAG: hypothetical protein EOP48_17155 [Sphingobacteriales bacterium]|nr:MAG: hypothetical protein EOP48_17155 [Sphingobacteriales bacterium]